MIVLIAILVQDILVRGVYTGNFSLCIHHLSFEIVLGCSVSNNIWITMCIGLFVTMHGAL